MLDDFENLKSQGEALLIQWKQEGKQEGIQLEFKLKDEAHKAGMNRKDDKLLGKVLSGLANAQGGLFVWGVDCRRNQEGIDCVTDLRPIANITSFKAEVDRKIGPFLMPRHGDIETLAIECRDKADAGYLAIKIGSSALRPHRSEAPDDKRYYRRTLIGTQIMEHYEIVDMLRINTVAQLKPHLASAKFRKDVFIYEAYVRVFLKNQSFVTAKSPYIAFKANRINCTQPKSGFSARASDGKKFKILHGDVNEVIHPGQSHNIFDILIQWKAGTESYCHSTDGQFWNYMNLKPLVFQGYCGCENSMPQDFELVLSASEIEQIFDKVRQEGNSEYRRRRL